ncbi:hypothetical protein AAFF_G00370950 [Aldrovandia affinis]|uniref:Peptidase S54 rhomboid domain-containing protein n=1 Tax=Aldrovandia affinis TaxID=143900 RepID=A0AAD7SGP8_9TELE|nr:hypothetical protein AAFF_G00370950 [Aldrovandia affinis]
MLGVLDLGTSVVVNGHVHKLFTYPFSHKDGNQLLLSAGVLLPFCSGLERSVGTVRFTYLLMLLSACTGLTHALMELLLFAAAERSHVQGFIPPALALLGMATVHSRMRKAVLLGVSVPTAALPWILLLFTLLIPDTVFLCNVVAILVGEIYGVGWFSPLDLSEARASVLDKKMPFRLMRMLATGLYVPASIEERRRTLHQLCRPAPGSYPVQAYAPASSVPSAQGTDASPHMYEALDTVRVRATDTVMGRRRAIRPAVTGHKGLPLPKPSRALSATILRRQEGTTLLRRPLLGYQRVSRIHY